MLGSAFGEAPHTTGAQTSRTQTKSHTHIIQSSQTSLQQEGYDGKRSIQHCFGNVRYKSGRIDYQHECGSTFGGHPNR